MKTIKPFAPSSSKCAILAACLLLTACAGVSPETRPARHPEAADLQPCPPLDKPADGSLAGLYRSHVSTAHRYHDCTAQHDSLIEWVKRGIEAGGGADLH